MCRHLAYLGPPVALVAPAFDAPHSLAHQAAVPRHQISGDTNPDGWGVAWYGDDAHRRPTVPHRRPRSGPTPASPNGTATLRSGAFLAAARLASPGATLDRHRQRAVRVRRSGSFSLNGIVHGLPRRRRRRAARRACSPTGSRRIVGDADTEVLFALVLDRLDDGATPADALASVVRDVLAITTGRLNLLLTDGAHVHGDARRQLAVRAADR